MFPLNSPCRFSLSQLQSQEPAHRGTRLTTGVLWPSRAGSIRAPATSSTTTHKPVGYRRLYDICGPARTTTMHCRPRTPGAVRFCAQIAPEENEPRSTLRRGTDALRRSYGWPDLHVGCYCQRGALSCGSRDSARREHDLQCAEHCLELPHLLQEGLLVRGGRTRFALLLQVRIGDDGTWGLIACQKLELYLVQDDARCREGAPENEDPCNNT